MKIDRDAALYYEQDDSHEPVDSAKISGAGATSREGSERHGHGVELTLGRGLYLIKVRAVVIQKDYFPLSYHHEFHCTSIDTVPEGLRDLSTMFGTPRL